MERKWAPVKVGARYGIWTVISLAISSLKGKRWECLCDCGTTRAVADAELKRGGSKCCGCLGNAKLSENTRERNITHGQSGSYMHRVWCGMRARCLDMNSKDYKNYGARGIVICPQWDDFTQFVKDMGQPAPGQTLDRKDNQLGYTPDNCRWASVATQNRNKRSNVLVTVGAQTMCFTDACEAIGVKKMLPMHW